MNNKLSHHQIAVRACECYAARGYQHGHDIDDWRHAESSQLAETAGTLTHGHPQGSDHHQHGAHDTRHRHGA